VGPIVRKIFQLSAALDTKVWEKEDYEHAKECFNAIAYYSDDKNTNETSDLNNMVFVEAIFLELTDRTKTHPSVPFKIEEKKGLYNAILRKLDGDAGKKIIWRYSELFDLQNYFEDDWFVQSLKMFPDKLEEMETAKKLYRIRRINFFEYFLKRLEVYKNIEASNFMKYYRGVDLEKYKDNLRQIFINLPILTKNGIHN
jgi:hypothetical protein